MPERPTVSLETIREAARAHAERVTVRDFAAEVGVPWTTLHAFLHGSEPRKENRRRLTEWYVRTMPARGDALTPELARYFVGMLLDGIPAAKKSEAERRVREVLTRVYKEAGAQPPNWLRSEEELPRK